MFGRNDPTSSPECVCIALILFPCGHDLIFYACCCLHRIRCNTSPIYVTHGLVSWSFEDCRSFEEFCIYTFLQFVRSRNLYIHVSKVFSKVFLWLWPSRSRDLVPSHGDISLSLDLSLRDRCSTSVTPADSTSCLRSFAGIA